MDAAIERFGRIDVLINNAGRAMARPVEHIDLAELTDLIELNVIAPLRLLQLVAPRMREQGAGQIITISSQAATKAIPFIGGYAATKSALRTLSLTAREELAADGITVSVVAPAIVDTDFGQNTPSPEPETLRRAHDGTLLPTSSPRRPSPTPWPRSSAQGRPKSACCPVDNPRHGTVLPDGRPHVTHCWLCGPSTA